MKLEYIELEPEQRLTPEQKSDILRAITRMAARRKVRNRFASNTGRT